MAKGCAQRLGLDFVDFSPVARLSSLRILVALSVELDLTLYQLDIEMAYINGELEESVYMKQPEAFIKHGKENLICLLEKSIYGLKQSGRQWHKKLDSKLKDHEMNLLNSDKCFYVKRSNSNILFVLVYVDDLVVATNDVKLYHELIRCLNREFQTRELGYCLGIEFIQDKLTKSVSVKQQKYAQNLLLRFGMLESKPKATPLIPKLDLSKEISITENVEVSKHEYQSLIENLMYLAVSNASGFSLLSKLFESIQPKSSKTTLACRKICT